MSLFLTVGAMAQAVSYTVSMSTGKLANYQSGTQGNWNYKWSFTTTEEKPVALTIAASNNANNIAPDGDNIKFFAGSANSCTYVLSVPEGYVIESYSFDYVTSGNNAVTITPQNGTAVKSSTTKATLSVEKINKSTAEFTLSGGNYGFSSSNFVVNIKEGMKFTEVGNPTEDGVYRVYWKQNNRGYLAYHNDYPTKGVLADVTLGSYGSSHFNSATDPVELEWYLITSEKGNKYLFSAYNGKFLSYSEESADAAKAAYFDAARPLPITIADNTSHSGYYIIKATVDGRECLLSSGCGTPSRTGYPIRWNSNVSGDMGDGGSPLIFVKVKNFPMDETVLTHAQATITDYEDTAEPNVNFEWTTSTSWTAVENSAYYTSTVLNDNALSGGVKYIEGEVTVGGARTATVTFTYIDGGHKLNIRGVEVIDAMGNIVAGDYHVGIAGGTPADNTYTVSVAEAGTYTVRCYAAEGGGDQFNSSHGSIVVSFAKLDVMELTKSVTFAAEYATLYLGYKVAIPAGVEAYVLTGVNSNWATLTQLNNIIPANTAVILKGTANSSYRFYYTSSEAEDVEINYLEGSIADRYVQGDAYVLGIPEGETEPALCKAVLNKVDNTSFKNNANKAYLKVAPGAAMSTSLRFDFDGTTGIEEVETEVAEDVIYDLTGRRVNEITKAGVYVVGGRKVMVK